jgi:SAM-dependent methyltransferase
LSYTKRKLIQYGYDKNVTLHQGDLLEVAALDSTFDYIECGGVLHHMKDPDAGLQALEKVLRNGGTMKIALYSELARQSVVKARELIAEYNLPPTPEGIRELRDIVKLRHDEIPLHRWSDFYSLSECRDLVFHVQEKRYTIEMIEAMLNKTGLKFSGFYVAGKTQSAFKKRFPEEGSDLELKNWAVFEEENPSTFKAMYNFYIRKG